MPSGVGTRPSAVKNLQVPNPWVLWKRDLFAASTWQQHVHKKNLVRQILLHIYTIHHWKDLEASCTAPHNPSIWPPFKPFKTMVGWKIRGQNQVSFQPWINHLQQGCLVASYTQYVCFWHSTNGYMAQLYKLNHKGYMLVYYISIKKEKHWSMTLHIYIYICIYIRYSL